MVRTFVTSATIPMTSSNTLHVITAHVSGGVRELYVKPSMPWVEDMLLLLDIFAI